MSLQKYRNSRGVHWAVYYTRPDGRRSCKRGFTTKAAAKAWEATNTSAILTGEWLDQEGGKTLLQEVGDKWLASQTHLKPSSFKAVKDAYRLRVRPTFGDTQLADIRHSDVKAWLAQLRTADGRKPLAATGRRYAYQVINNILETAVRDGLIGTNPARGIPQPKKQAKRQVFLTNEQLHQLAEACGEYRTLILVLGYTGLRWGEAIALTGSDINLVTRRINIDKNVVWLDGKPIPGSPKSGKGRTVPIPEFLSAALTKQVAKVGNGLLWTSPEGSYLPRPPSQRGWFQQALIAANLPRITPHDLRHTAASLAVQSGANVKAIQRMLGHTSAAMTLDVYAALFDDDLDDVARRMDERVRLLGLV